MISNKYKNSSEIQEITNPPVLTIRLKPEGLRDQSRGLKDLSLLNSPESISKDYDEYTRKLKQDFKEAEEDQANTRKKIEAFIIENEVTKEAIGIEAIYQIGFASYENRFLKMNINDCESDICNLEQQNEYLEKVLNEYKKKHGELNKTQLDEFKKGFESALHIDIINDKMMKRLERSRLIAKKQLPQLKQLK